MATAPEGPRWGEIAAAVARDFGLVNNRSPALTTAIERGVRFIVVDQKASELVFDTHALFLGFLAAGQQDRQSINFGNTASWFANWLTQRVGGDQIAVALAPEQMTEPDLVFRTFAGGFKVTLSRSVRALLQSAQKIAVETNRPSEFEARHLFTAMLQGDYIAAEIARTFSVTLPPDQMQALKAELAERIMGQPAPGETAELWRQALGLPPPGDGETPDTPTPDPGAAPPPPEDGVTGFSRDSVPPSPTDPLRTAADAEALARLMCLEDAAPLAIAVFGGWGSGKSTFMNRLDAAVRKITEGQGEIADADTGAPAARFVERVVQIRFNAWQFVDANLWASLTSEFFDQLRAGGWDRASGARHAGLVERVNRHVHSLNAEVEARREAAATGGKEVLKAQQARDVAAKAAKAAPGATLGQAALDALGKAYEAQKGNLTALGLAVSGEDTGKAIDAIVVAASSTRSLWGQLTAIWKVLAKSQARLALTAVLLLAVAGAVLALGWLLVEHPLDAWNGLQVALGAIGALGAIAAAVTASPAFKLVRSIVKRSADIAKQVGDADEKALKDLLQSEVALREATTEADALQAAAIQASQQLSRYVAPDGKPNPPRLLRYVLEDDPDTKALAAEIGLIGRTRRLFQTVDDIAREERLAKPAERTAPDRVVLYIDDLDRCTDEQVYNVLQAIHLLLAFELFVVVVGVDVTRVQGALARALAPREARGMDQDERTGLAAAYLEKIFQVAFWLAPLAADDPDGGSFGRYLRDLAGPPRRAAPAPDAETSPPDISLAAPAGDSVGTPPDKGGIDGPPDAAESEQEEADAEDAVQATRRSLATIQLTVDEIGFLASPAIAAVAASTPRGVKRLLNVYRLVRSRLSSEGVSILGDDRDSHPAYPIIAFMVAVETGQPVEVADKMFTGLKALDPQDSLDQHFRNAGSPGLPIAEAYDASPGLRVAMEAVLEMRARDLKASDILKVARVARRFSFNING